MAKNESVQTVRKEITKHGLSQSKVVVQSAVLNLHYSFFAFYQGLQNTKKPPHTGGVSFRFTFRKNAICMRRHFYEPERKKIVFCEL
jgi:hypothetical protein